MTCVPHSMNAGCKQTSASEVSFSHWSDGVRRRAGLKSKMNVVRQLRRPNINRPRAGMFDGDCKHGNRGQRRRRCQSERSTDGAEVVPRTSAIVVSRVIWLGLRRRCYCSGRSLKIFEMDMPKRQVKLDRQGEQSCPGTQSSVASNPMHFGLESRYYPKR